MDTPIRRRWLDDPTTILLIGIVGLLTCQVLAPLAWYMAAHHMMQCELDGRVADPFVPAARWLGIIGTVILGVAVFGMALTWILVGLQRL